MLQILTLFLQHGYRVIFASPADHSDHATDLPAMGIEQHSIRLNCSSFDEWLVTQHPDVVMFDRFMMEEQFGWRVEQHAPAALRLLDMEDVHCLRDARHRAVKAGRDLQPADWHSPMAFREVAAILRCDLTLVISEYEMQWLQTECPVPASKLMYLPFMADAVSDVKHGAEVRPYAERDHFVSIGNFRHAPNWDAVLELRRLWPGIRKKLPDAELHIYGAYPPKKATQLHDESLGFLVKGWAVDAQEVIGRARVLLSPLRFGAGLKGKLLEAAQLGTPAVTSPVGAEGMYGELQPPAATACSDHEFIEAAVSVYTDEAVWQKMSAAGPDLVVNRFNATEHGKRLMNGIDQHICGLERYREMDFIGGMLRHHYLKSTQYMSQWIEAKNRASGKTDDRQ